MVLGGGMTQKLFQTVRIKVFGEGKLSGVRERYEQVKRAAGRAAGSINRTSNKMDEAGSSANDAGGQFGKLFGIGMNLMFIGMALQQVFGGLVKTMFKMTGVSQTFGAAFKSVLLPFFLTIAPKLRQFALSLMQLPKGVKMVIGAFVALAAVLGTLLFFGAQFALLMISGLSMGMVATAAGVAAGALAILIAGFKLGMMIGNQFGDEVRFAMEVASTMINRFAKEGVDVLQGLLGMLTNIAMFVLNVLTLNFDDAAQNIIAVWQNFAKVVSSLLEGLFITDFLELIATSAKKLLDGAVEIGKNILKGIANGIKSARSLITSALESILPSWAIPLLKKGLALSGPMGLAASSLIDVNDFILTSGGKLLQPDSNDTIVGFNGNGPIQPGGSGQVEVNINDPVMREDVDVQRVVDEVEERVNRDSRGRSTGL